MKFCNKYYLCETPVFVRHIPHWCLSATRQGNIRVELSSQYELVRNTARYESLRMGNELGSWSNQYELSSHGSTCTSFRGHTNLRYCTNLYASI